MKADGHCILQVEDDENEIVLQKYAFKTVGLVDLVVPARDGQAAIDYLTAALSSEHAQTHPMPALVLLDLELPVVHGLEVLRWIRQQPQLRRLPVIIHTSSENPAYVLDAYQLGANSFVRKPKNMWERARMIEALKSWWFEFNLFPGPVPERPQQFAETGSGFR